MPSRRSIVLPPSEKKSSSFGRDLPPFELGYVGTELRRRLVAAVLCGKKTATSALLEDDQPPARPGDRFVLVDFDDHAVAVVETTEVRIVRAGDVDLPFAIDEGEGFETVAAWRAAHERFWSDRVITDETPIVAERFRVVETL